MQRNDDWLQRNKQKRLHLPLLYLQERKKEIEELERQLAKEQLSEFVLDEDTIRRFFFELKNKAKKEPHNRRVLINIFVNKVFVYDNKLIIYFNGSHNETELTEVFLTETEKKLSGNNAESDCSSDTPSGSPKKKASLRRNIIKLRKVIEFITGSVIFLKNF